MNENFNANPSDKITFSVVHKILYFRFLGFCGKTRSRREEQGIRRTGCKELLELQFMDNDLRLCLYW